MGGPANLNLSLDVVDIFANNYNIFEPEVRRGFFYALFFTRGLNSTAAVQGKSSSKTSSTNSNVFDAVIELGAKDQDQWVQAISKAINSRTTTRGTNSDQTTSTSNKHFTLKKLEKPRRKSYLEVSAKRVNRFGDVISNVDSSTTGATTTGSTAIVSKSLESSFQQQQQQMKPKSSFLLDTKKRTISSHGYQASGTKRTFENRDGSAKDMEKEKEIRLQRLKLIKEKEAERKRVAEEEMKKRRENYKASVEAKKRALDIQEKSKTTIISTPSPSDRT